MISPKLLLLLCVFPLSAGAIEVTTLVDEVDNGGSVDDEWADGTGLSLREAIGLVNRGVDSNTVSIYSQVFDDPDDPLVMQLSPALGEILITAPLYVDSNVEVVLDAAGESRIFSIHRPENYMGEFSVYIDKFEFRDGSAEGDGGAIHVDSGVALELADCQFASCTATGSGGAIYASGEGAVVEVFSVEEQMTFAGCIAGGNGGAMAAENGAASHLRGDAISCEAGGNGGAIFQSGGGGSFSGEITGCSATNGGAIYYSDLFAWITTCRLLNNVASGNGGAIMATDVVLSPGPGGERLISGNRAVDGAGIYAVNFTSYEEYNSFNMVDNIASGDGGGIWASGSVFRLQDSTLSGNSAAGAGGGGGLYCADTKLEWYGGSIDDNQASSNTARGGGCFISQPSAEIVFTSIALNGNSAGSDGGGIYFESDIYNLDIVDLNSCSSNRSLGGNGGALASVGDVSVVFLCIDPVTENSAGGSGGALYLFNSNWFVSGNFSANTCHGGGGGAVYVKGVEGELGTADPSDILGAFEDNHANGAAGYGGAIAVASGEVIIAGRIEGNSATDAGGGLAIQSGRSIT